MGLLESIKETLEKDDLNGLEELSEWWMGHNYEPNNWETEIQYNYRKSLVLPLIIEQKLIKYEEEY